jgi:Taurine catabolism dioxygenase TauD, TfdA family
MKSGLAKLLSTKADSGDSTSKVEFSFLFEEENFPLVIKPESSGLILAEWIKANMELFNQKLIVHGAILFRGFEINTVERFKDFMSVFDSSLLEYRQRSSPRYEVSKNIYHSTTYPEDQSINMHSENSYSPNWARKIIFCCIQPAAEQGETPIADNRLVVKYLTPPTRDKFLKNGVKYVRNISKGIGLSWQEVFQTTEKAQVEEECMASGMTFKWISDDQLILTWNNRAIYSHPDTHEEIWFNHAFFFNKHALSKAYLSAFDSVEDLPFNTYYGDGSEITEEEIEEIRAAYEKATVVFSWVKGDVLFLDNMLTAHGRSPYKGDRKIIVSML